MGLFEYFRSLSSDGEVSRPSRRFSLFKDRRRTSTIDESRTEGCNQTDETEISSDLVSNTSCEFALSNEKTDQTDENLGSIHEYRIIKELGRGSTSVVQLGQHKSFTDKSFKQVDESTEYVALKVYQTSILKRMREFKRVGKKMVVSTALDKVQVEIAIMKKLRHENLIQLLEIFDDDSEMLVLMLEYAPLGQIMTWDCKHERYVPNPNVRQSVRDNQDEVSPDRFTEKEAREFFRQMLLGLEYLHENNICHRDLKPENILIGANSICKIADFGVANLFEQTDAKVSSSGKDSLLSAHEDNGMVTTTAGTYAFMGPETIKGGGYSAYAADVWALGITLHALVLGEIPFYHANMMELFKLIELQSIELNPRVSVSDSLADLLHGMLNKDPKKRWTVQQCKQHPWVVDGMNTNLRETFLNVECEQVQVNSEEIAAAVTRVTSLNVMVRIKLGANKWRRQARKSLEMKRMASNLSDVSLAPSCRESMESDTISHVAEVMARHSLRDAA
uniref:Protein kinase putative n=1 Tax=Albugo laibachii Nc14 TaxID=890382 RepID=F0W976_9STRA|nr:protein kinase putative [Albugo laibachii Nc14]|eukprot:CCA17689.1 protein kinase putative [Albugo laibachii Nc14]